MQAACNAADVIVLLFATDRGDALARIGSHWLPELRRIGVRAPVILVGTKSDTKSADHNLQQVTCMQKHVKHC
jgi:mitochondrial Rho GTPase 1